MPGGSNRFPDWIHQSWSPSRRASAHFFNSDTAYNVVCFWWGLWEATDCAHTGHVRLTPRCTWNLRKLDQHRVQSLYMDSQSISSRISCTSKPRACRLIIHPRCARDRRCAGRRHNLLGWLWDVVCNEWISHWIRVHLMPSKLVHWTSFDDSTKMHISAFPILWGILVFP